MLCELAQLTQVYSPCLPANCRHFVQHPARPGLQPCLIECPRSDDSVELIDALIVLPSDASYVAAGTDPVYSAALVAIRSAYGPELKRLSDTDTIQMLAGVSRNRPPFTPATLRLLAESALDLVSALAKEAPHCTAELIRLNTHLAPFVEPASGAIFWTPQYVLAGKMRTDRRALILAHWRHWEAKNLPWSKRAKEHTDACRTSNGLSRGALIQRCNELGLAQDETGTSKSISRSAGVVWRAWPADGFLPAELVQPKSKRRNYVTPRTRPFP